MRIETDPDFPHAERRWWVRSAYELSVFSRAGAYGRKDNDPNLQIRNRDPATADPKFREIADVEGPSGRFQAESDFLSEELSQGMLYVSGNEMSLIENGLRAVARSQRVFRSVHPREATRFLQLLDEQRAAVAVDAAMPAAEAALAHTVSVTPEDITVQDLRSNAENGKVLN